MAMLVGIAGITGQLARLLSLELLEDSAVSIRGFCRNASKVPTALGSVEVVEGNADDSEKVAQFVKGCDIVVCCYQGDDELMLDGQKLLIDACEDAGVARYMASDWCIDYTKLELGQLFPKDPMKYIKAHLETKKTVKGVHVLTGILFEAFFSPYFGIYDAQFHTFSHWGDPEVRFEGTSYRNAAQFTASIVRNKDIVGVRRYRGDIKSMPDIARSFEKVYGVKADVVCNGSADDLYKKMWAVRDRPGSHFYEYLAMFYQHYIVNEQTYVGPTLDNTTVKQVSWEEFMQMVPLEQLPRAYENVVTEKV